MHKAIIAPGRRFRLRLGAASLLLPLLLLLGCAASAQSPLAVAPLAVPEGCDAKRAAIVREAFILAERQTAEAIAFIRANPRHPHVQTWFGTGSPEKVEARLAMTHLLLRGGAQPAWTCGNADSCGSHTTFALALLREGSIRLCPPFFEAANSGADSRPGILVHEVSHLVAQTDDVSYGQQAARRLAEKDPQRAIINADNLEYFVEFLPR